MWKYEPAVFGDVSLKNLRVSSTLDIDSVTIP